MNPWLTIWVRPKQTIRHIVDTNPKRFVLFLAMLAGVASWLMQGGGIAIANVKRGAEAAGGTFPIAIGLLFVVVLGAVGGLFWLYLCGWLYRWVGSWFGGQAKNVEVRAAIAWVEVLTLAIFVLWLMMLFVTGGRITGIHDGQQPVGFSQFFEVLATLVFVAAFFAVGIWRVVLTCHTLGEVHRFSAWKGLGTLLIPHAMLVVPVAVIALLAAIAIPNLLRARTVANESAAIGNLRTLVTAVETFRAVQLSYPDAWQADMYVDAPVDFGLPDFNLDIQSTAQTVQGYQYRYQPAPSGCRQPECVGYTFTAIPETPTTGRRSFFVDEPGTIRHCTGGEGAHATDPEIVQEPVPCS